MRLFTRALLSLVLMFVALVAVNALRLGRVPAQGAPVAARNGDVNCDGLLNITDPILVLNWLFSDGPEPCAIAQADTCCTEVREELASLRAEVATLSSRVPSPQNIIHLKAGLRLPAQGGEGVVYKVPDDKWLVLTASFFNGLGVTLYQRLNGTSEEIPSGQEADRSGPTGFPVAPGSEIVVSYPRSFSDPPAPFTVDYLLHGYLAGE